LWKAEKLERAAMWSSGMDSRSERHDFVSWQGLGKSHPIFLTAPRYEMVPGETREMTSSVSRGSTLCLFMSLTVSAVHGYLQRCGLVAQTQDFEFCHLSVQVEYSLPLHVTDSQCCPWISTAVWSSGTDTRFRILPPQCPGGVLSAASCHWQPVLSMDIYSGVVQWHRHKILNPATSVSRGSTLCRFMSLSASAVHGYLQRCGLVAQTQDFESCHSPHFPDSTQWHGTG
jgi:hypothetical protein